MTGVSPAPGGLTGEAVWHEDWNDPGDASGIYLRLREANGSLIVEASSWNEAPGEVWKFFTLVRSGDAKGRQVCPFD